MRVDALCLTGGDHIWHGDKWWRILSVTDASEFSCLLFSVRDTMGRTASVLVDPEERVDALISRTKVLSAE